MRFNHKVVAITGAAQGIGRQTAEQAAREGARLLLIDRSRYVHELAAALNDANMAWAMSFLKRRSAKRKPQSARC